MWVMDRDGPGNAEVTVSGALGVPSRKDGRFLKPFTGQGQGICARNGIPGLRTRELSSLEGCGSSRERTFRSQKIIVFG